MMNEVRYADLLDKLGEMSQAQLAGLLTATEDRMAERLDRFQYLCKQLEMYLDTIFKEFPNANVYLVKSPEEKLITAYVAHQAVVVWMYREVGCSRVPSAIFAKVRKNEKYVGRW